MRVCWLLNVSDNLQSAWDVWPHIKADSCSIRLLVEFDQLRTDLILAVWLTDKADVLAIVELRVARMASLADCLFKLDPARTFWQHARVASLFAELLFCLSENVDVDIGYCGFLHNSMSSRRDVVFWIRCKVRKDSTTQRMFLSRFTAPCHNSLTSKVFLSWKIFAWKTESRLSPGISWFLPLKRAFQHILSTN